MPDAIITTADKIWAAIQRPFPAITKDEIMDILRVAMDAPTAVERSTCGSGGGNSGDAVLVIHSNGAGGAGGAFCCGGRLVSVGEPYAVTPSPEGVSIRHGYAPDTLYDEELKASKVDAPHS